MGCSELNSDLFKIGVVNTQICVCGHGPETSYHFFFVCQKYILIRNELHSKIIHLSSFNLKTILYGDDKVTSEDNCRIVDAVIEFIVQSKRFMYFK